MKTTTLRYTTIIRKEGKYYVADVPTLGISDFGKSIEEVKKNIKGTIEITLEGLAKIGDEIPQPDAPDFYVSQSEVSIPKGAKFAF